jgi:hypothetical protein
MEPVTGEAVVVQIVTVLREAFEGTEKGSGSYFIDPGPDGGFFGTLVKLDSGTASRAVGGNSIASHVHHVAFGLEASAAWIRGDRSPRDWKESWSVKTVDDPEWRTLLETLRRRYDDLRSAIETHSTSGDDSMGGAIGGVAHAAYHLGAVRQKLAGMALTS